MKIMMLNDSMVRGGRERRLIELLKGLSHYPDIQCELVLLSGKVEYPEIYDLNIPVHILERKPNKDPRVFYKLYRLCRQRKPDIIHSWAMMSSIYALVPKLLLGTKLLNAGITSAPKNMSFFYENYFRGRITFPFSDAVLSNSIAGLKAFKAPVHKSRCIYNGFDFQRIKHLGNKDDVRRKLNIKTSKVIGMVGGFQPRKDYHTYIQAACQLLETRPDTTFLAIGNGPNLQACKGMVPEKFQDRILFPGLRKEIEPIINVFDIGVLTTNTKVHQEGISNSILEYMVLGKPAVATAGGGTNELIIDGETGYLIAPHNPDELCEKLVSLLDAPQLAEQMGQNGRERVHQNFSLERMEKEFRKLYDGLMKGTLPTGLKAV